MLVQTVANGKKLVDTGQFHVHIENEENQELDFSYNGLKVKLKINILKDSDSQQDNIQASVDSGVVIFNHYQKIPGIYAPFGVVTPIEVGRKPDGKAILITWMVSVLRGRNSVVVAIVSYSFYEEV